VNKERELHELIQCMISFIHEEKLSVNIKKLKNKKRCTALWYMEVVILHREKLKVFHIAKKGKKNWVNRLNLIP